MSQGVSEDHCARCGVSVCLNDEGCKVFESDPVPISNSHLAVCAGVGLVIGFCFSLLLGLHLPDFLGGSEWVAHTIVALIGAYGGLEFGQSRLPRLLEWQRHQNPCRFEEIHGLREEERRRIQRGKDEKARLERDPKRIRTRINKLIEILTDQEQTILDGLQDIESGENPDEYDLHYQVLTKSLNEIRTKMAERRAELGYLEILNFLSTLDEFKNCSVTSSNFLELCQKLDSKKEEGNELLQRLQNDEKMVSTEKGAQCINVLKMVLNGCKDTRRLIFTKGTKSLRQEADLPAIGEDIFNIIDEKSVAFSKDVLLKELIQEYGELQQQNENSENEYEQTPDIVPDFFKSRLKEPVRRK